MYNTLNNPSAHPSYSLYYLLSPSTLFCFSHLIVFFTSYCFALFYFIAHFTLISLFFTIYMLLCCVTLYYFYFYYFALSTERTWFDYISLLIIHCIIYYVTNKETLNLEPWRRLAEVQTEHQNGEERVFMWHWTWNACWCQTGCLSISKTADLLGFSRTSITRVYREWSEKEKISSERMLCGRKCLVDVRG